jgi:DNA modification methylase
MKNEEIIRKINTINWDFDFEINYDEKTLRPFNCRKYYSYPATFIPEIPYTLIELLSRKGDVIMDPFGGIGTTFMQALLLKRYPISFDINLVASDICSTLYSAFNPLFDHINTKIAFLSIPEKYNAKYDYIRELSPLRKELENWYEKETFNKLSYLFKSFDEISDYQCKIILKLIISSILTTLSSQKKGWAYIADNVKPKSDELRSKDVFKVYQILVTSLFDNITDYMNILKNDHDSYVKYYDNTTKTKRIFNSSILESTILDNSSVDLIITSPPYPKMTDYVKSQRLTFYFYNKDFEPYAKDELGARFLRNKKNVLYSYIDSIKLHVDKMKVLLKNNGYMCLLLPDYEETEKEKERRNAISEIINHCFKSNLDEVCEIKRYIPSHKRTLSIQWASLVNERIYIFKKR